MFFKKTFKSMHRTIITMEKSKNVLAFIIGIMSKLVWNMNSMILHCETKFNELYNTNSLVRQPTDWVCRIRDTIYNYFDKSLKEPPYKCWSGLYQIINNKLTYSYDIKDLESITEFNEHNSFYRPFIFNVPDKNNVCVVSKFNGFYKIFFNQLEETEEISLCNRKMLSVFYMHPELTDSFQLKIPEEMLLVNNQLLNPTFVFRCLQIQNIFTPFDNRYTIQIMDSEIDEYNIQYGQFLQVNKDSFEVKDI